MGSAVVLEHHVDLGNGNGGVVSDEHHDLRLVDRGTNTCLDNSTIFQIVKEVIGMYGVAEDLKFSFVDKEGQDLGYRFFRWFKDQVVSITLSVSTDSVSVNIVQHINQYTHGLGMSDTELEAIRVAACLL